MFYTPDVTKIKIMRCFILQDMYFGPQLCRWRLGNTYVSPSRTCTVPEHRQCRSRLRNSPGRSHHFRYISHQQQRLIRNGWLFFKPTKCLDWTRVKEYISKWQVAWDRCKNVLMKSGIIIHECVCIAIIHFLLKILRSLRILIWNLQGG